MYIAHCSTLPLDQDLAGIFVYNEDGDGTCPYLSAPFTYPMYNVRLVSSDQLRILVPLLSTLVHLPPERRTAKLERLYVVEMMIRLLSSRPLLLSLGSQGRRSVS